MARMSHHRAQVAAEVRRRLQLLLARGLSDPRVRGLVSITDLTVAPDLSEAYVKISVMPEQHGSLTLQGLVHAAGHLQTEISRGTRLRRVPRLLFQLDDTIKRQAKLESALRGADVHESDEAGSAGEDPGEERTT